MCPTSDELRAWDEEYLWHPFTPHSVYQEEEPLMVVEGDGNYLIDVEGHRYLDAVSSIWCNVFGHRHPEIDDAIRKQLDRIAHATFLGNATGPAVELGKRLVEITPENLTRVFYSDSGSTAVEVALKIATQYWQQTEGEASRTRFLTLRHAYHGDTVGSVSLGGMDLFHARYHNLLFETITVEAPYCYRCPFGLERESCQEACIDKAIEAIHAHGEQLAGIFLEPMVQGAAGMITQPPGFLKRLSDAAHEVGALVILDEVAVGFGRSGDTLFACQQAGVEPDLLCLAKGLTGGYLPLAATLATEEIFSAFLGPPEEGRTFFHGHTYTGNPLGAAAAMATLDIFEREKVMESLPSKVNLLTEVLETLRLLPGVGDIRQWGLMAGVELVKDKESKESFAPSARMAMKVCRAARDHGVFLRPLGDTLVIVPPLSVTDDELRLIGRALAAGLETVMGEEGR